MQSIIIYSSLLYLVEKTELSENKITIFVENSQTFVQRFLLCAAWDQRKGTLSLKVYLKVFETNVCFVNCAFQNSPRVTGK